VVAGSHLGDGRSQRLFCAGDESFRITTDHPDPDGERRIAVPALDDRPTVNPDDVALNQYLRTRDSVNDHLIHRRADHRRKTVVTEEVRRGAPPIEDVAGNDVEVAGRHARAYGLSNRVVHLGHHTPSATHGLQLISSSPHQATGHRTSPGSAPTTSVDDGNQSP
jgi:hypothetical protein